MDDETNILYKEESYLIQGACFEVYKHKGCGFHEPIYHECLEIELSLREIPHFSKPKIPVEYKGRPLSQHFEPDFVCFGKIVVELKALPKLLEVHRVQVLNYLRASSMRLGILANFGHYPRLEYLRVTANDRWSSPSDIDLQS